ncbi:MAG: ATP-binding protein [Saprospiraceae bacterium]
MIDRSIAMHIRQLAAQFPVVSVTGPRQSGKTTLVKQLFPHFAYVNLEDIELRQLAEQDPKYFLQQFPGGLIVDEAQYVPALFSYIQLEADRRGRAGEFVLTGSQHFLFMEKITQSLAGRVAIFTLLPFSETELKNTAFQQPSIDDYLLKGMYPRLYEAGIDPAFYYPNYIQSYIERDVRQLINIGDVGAFRTFLELSAGRIGQLYNQTNIGNEADLDHKTVNRWFSILETSFIAFKLRPYFQNYNKRILKTPKLYFYDTGIVCALLGIRTTEQLKNHPIRGALFENWIVVEMLKKSLNKGIRPNMYYWRDQTGNEIDLLIDEGGSLYLMEIKSGMTYNAQFFKNIRFFNALSGNNPDNSYLLYAGTQHMQTKDGHIRGWAHLPELM